MSKFSGKNLIIEITGESHSENLQCSFSGLKNFTIDERQLKEFLERRSSKCFLSTSRVEDDLPVFNIEKDKISFTIQNKNVRKTDYENLYGKPRPSHADLAWFIKDGTLDFSGGGRFSGRLTAPFCVIGGICKQFLKSKGIMVEGYISKVGKINALSYKKKRISYDEIIKKAILNHNRDDIKNDIAQLKNDTDKIKTDVDKIKNIYINGDGAAWIKSGTNYIAPSKFVLDKYHMQFH